MFANVIRNEYYLCIKLLYEHSSILSAKCDNLLYYDSSSRIQSMNWQFKAIEYDSFVCYQKIT